MKEYMVFRRTTRSVLISWSLPNLLEFFFFNYFSLVFIFCRPFLAVRCSLCQIIPINHCTFRERERSGSPGSGYSAFFITQRYWLNKYQSRSSNSIVIYPCYNSGGERQAPQIDLHTTNFLEKQTLSPPRICSRCLCICSLEINNWCTICHLSEHRV